MREEFLAPDVLRWPAVGRFLRWRRARTTLQLLLLVIAVAIVLHGLFGPRTGPANLATVLVWIHYRGLLVLALLVAGNVFCTACPMVLLRDVGRRFHAPSRRWPRWLRTKWIGLALFVAVLFSYELFDLWNQPRATAWLVLGYFVAALMVDLLFAGASFCKYVCPIGQFNFAASTMSPLELRVREPDTCRACRTADCIKGRRDGGARGPISQRGCELGLFLPAKVGNLDCTFCLDCVQACPHDNVALALRVSGLELADPRRRSGIGRLARREDIAALAILFAFGGLVNAFGMIAPVDAVERGIRQALGVPSEAPVLAAIFLAILGVMPVVLVGGAAALTGRLCGGASVRRIAVDYAYAFVPFGFGMWLSHYGFHLLTGVLTAIPVGQSAALDLTGRAILGTPRWGWTGMRPGSVFPIQLGLIALGSMGSLGLAFRISERDHPNRAIAATAPWAAAILALTGVAIWILMQPMAMRGMAGMGFS
jgi:hypothetical protein